ncbi:GNAT family N-acetyltransferase [Peribacillus deserti]|uniref:GNAT family N-acetyltransferase n=1 Tax=Peribacillus deserti TaxID=673318 RepID=A0A2N5M498_9BACI|nr:GNAT family N-acetyltransferase [Peribacillus deserti]PLT29093.1 GNAT family N-acetyltransferase [Peribacillus deserti]
MSIQLCVANESDAQVLFDIQICSFKPLLEKYEDYETSPANESIEKLISRINYPNGVFYKIMFDGSLVGGVRVVWQEESTHFRLSIMFIHPDFQGLGLAQKVFSMLDDVFPQATSWELDTLLEETRNCHLYEKMGYVKTGVFRKINDKTTLVSYQRIC